MGCINQRYISQVDVIGLDSCGRIKANPTVSAIIRMKLKDITVTDVVDAGTELNEKLADGNVCASDPACKTLTGKDIELGGCGINPALDDLFGFGTVTLASGVTTDIAYTDYNCSKAVMIQVIYKGAANCTGGTVSSWSELYPFVSAWERINPPKIDGNTALNGGYKGRATKHGNGFTATGGTTALAELPTQLSLWTAQIAAVNAGTAFGFGKLAATPTQPADYGCELSALAAIA